ncbi:prepilin-type N-terminal cleavage/methylation domain-containing protein [Dyella tabacisoli]|uniref:prepilin-type N-terminal cleavage/methylation domain-containing protein n=1 Tax=Dyella tabacisoli TaxID=2282381 RepID=UPI001CDC3E62|nr:prepilin-type N-terminal cleavage/methylation domain-containing protein [Dyella tabacisoli]
MLRRAHRSPFPVPCSLRSTGFSLLEVLAALALMALLLLGVYAGISTATHSVRSGTAVIERLDQIRSAQQFLRHELTQTSAIPWDMNAQHEPIVFSGSAKEIRFVAPLPGYLGKLGPQLQTLTLVEEGKDNTHLAMSFAMLSPDGIAADTRSEPEVLVSHIRSVHFSYYGSTKDQQPEQWLETWPPSMRLPSLIRIEVTLDDGMVFWPRLDIPIRQGASAINVRAVAMPLLYGRGLH